MVLDGQGGYLTTAGPVMDETGSFTATVKVKLDKAKLDAKPVGYRAQVFSQAAATGEESSWALWVDKVDPDGDGVPAYLWHFGRTATDAAGKVTESASVSSEAAAELDTWVQLTGVFDSAEETGAGYGKTHLYVGHADQAGDTEPAFTSPVQGKGPLNVGRGSAGGSAGWALPARIGELRVWTGAMTADQINEKVLGFTGVR